MKNRPKSKRQAGDEPEDQKDEDESEGHGFHDEFMARIDEFSLSWRQAAMNERKKD